MQDKIKLIAQYLGTERVKISVNLKDFFSSNINAYSDGLYIATSLRELENVVKSCIDLNLSFKILGFGSEIKFNNNYFNGLVIKNRSDNVRIFGIKGKVSRDGIGVEEAMIEAESGLSFDSLIKFAHKNNLSGFEDFLDNEGTIGGCLITSAELRERALSLKVITKEGEILERSQIKDGDVILSAVFKMSSKRK